MSNVHLPFADRIQAGRALAESLVDYQNQEVLVLALPRGGVPVAYEVAQKLSGTLDILLVRKLGTPEQHELACGAIASGGLRVLNTEVICALGITDEVIDRITMEEEIELDRRERLYRGNRNRPNVEGRVVILVDDGVATGSTMRVAIAALRLLHPKKIVVASPVGASDTIETLRKEADEVVCLATPSPFVAIGLWYQNFQQVSDEVVCQILGTRP